MKYHLKKIVLFVLVIISKNVFSQDIWELRQKVNQIVSNKEATTGVAIMGFDGQDSLTITGDSHFPMQSVFKFHVALAVLSDVDKGKLNLNQKIKIDRMDLLPNLYSPIRDEYPNGVTLSLSEILDYTVSQSDNVGLEVLLKLIGGPEVVEKYLKVNGIRYISIKINEIEQQANWDLQFKNWTTPKAANQTLEKFYTNTDHLLSKKNHDFLWKLMKKTKTGENSIRGKLPANTIIAHKTGHSGTNEKGITAAENDIGIIFLPNGKYFYLSVFVSNSKENKIRNPYLYHPQSYWVEWPCFWNEGHP